MTNEILTAIIIGIVSIGISLWIIKLQFYSKPKRELEHLKLQFRINQELSLNIKKNIEELIDMYGLGNNYIFEGMKYQTYYELLIKHYNESLSHERYSDLDLFKKNREAILSATRSLENQFSNLNQVYIQTNVTLKEIANI